MPSIDGAENAACFSYSPTLLPSLLAATALSLAPSHAVAITFDDGQLSVINAANSFPSSTLTVVVIPEPSSALLMGLGLLGLAWLKAAE